MNQEDQSGVSPELREAEEKEVEKRSGIRATVVHEAIRHEGEEELKRPSSALAWSGLAAGLSMGFSLIGEGLLRSHLPEASWRPLVAKFGYSLGFLIVILGRQQLFTENTLTAVLPVLARRSRSALLQMLRLWGTVLLTNLIGAAIIAWVLSSTGVFEPHVKDAFRHIGEESAKAGFGTILLRGIFAGWLIALVVWLMPAAEGGAVFLVIVVLTYFVGLGGFSHIIAGSVEVMYLASGGVISWGKYFIGYMIPTLLGNIIGGTSLVAALNHAQVIAGGGRQNE